MGGGWGNNIKCDTGVFHAKTGPSKKWTPGPNMAAKNGTMPRIWECCLLRILLKPMGRHGQYWITEKSRLGRHGKSWIMEKFRLG